MEAQKFTREQILDQIVDYFEEHEDVFNDAIEALDSYNGYLGDDRFYYMDELNEFYQNPLDAMQRAYYGHDGEVWTTDERGEKHFGEFNPMREYFTYNGYGNLVSYDSKDYSAYLCRATVEDMNDNRCNIDFDFDDDLCALFEELDYDEEAYRASRKPFTPKRGKIYENEGGGRYECTSYKSSYARAIFRNVRSGWNFVAHGIGIYEDGKIDWDYSTDGTFTPLTDEDV